MLIWMSPSDIPLLGSVLLTVARQTKRKDFCKSLSDFFRQFNNFFLKEREREKKAAFVFLQRVSVLWLRWHGFWTAPCRRRSQTEGSSLSALAIITVIKPQVNGNSLNICRYKSNTVGKWPKGSVYWSITPQSCQWRMNILSFNRSGSKLATLQMLTPPFLARLCNIVHEKLDPPHLLMGTTALAWSLSVGGS